MGLTKMTVYNYQIDDRFQKVLYLTFRACFVLLREHVLLYFCPSKPFHFCLDCIMFVERLVSRVLDEDRVIAAFQLVQKRRKYSY